ncbi:MAG TPA: NAD-dependent epimerase/dehydratase family protein, partial [Myxococcaceae bacterium]|nr:NAD-dependent epimerase/dehydratase family protein [Myxococcaceae bacterium]
MTTSRRQFLQFSLAAASLAACAPSLRSVAGDERSAPPQKKKILILGGTGFLGPAFVTAAQARGHELTLFNRGKTRPEL